MQSREIRGPGLSFIIGLWWTNLWPVSQIRISDASTAYNPLRPFTHFQEMILISIQIKICLYWVNVPFLLLFIALARTGFEKCDRNQNTWPEDELIQLTLLGFLPTVTRSHKWNTNFLAAMLISHRRIRRCHISCECTCFPISELLETRSDND